MAYPSAFDSYTAVVGTTLVASADHANMHNVAGSAVVALEAKLGLGSGTPTANSLLIGVGAGTSSWSAAGTLNAFTFGTPTITGGIATGLTSNAATLGTPAVTGGSVINSLITGGTVSTTTVLLPLQSAFFASGSSTLVGASPIPFSTEQLDTLSEYNGTAFIPTVSGIYQFFSCLSTSGNAADYDHQIVYNGTVKSSTRANANGIGIPVSWMGSVTAAGTVYVTTSSGTGAILTNSYFYGKRVY